MRIFRVRRISRSEADALLEGQSGAEDRAELRALLRTAAAPATPDELAGERQAVAAFATAARAARERRPAPRRRRTLLRRIGVVKLAALVLLVLGGTAFAARTGSLPAPVQQGAHSLFSPLGVPAPDPGLDDASQHQQVTARTPSLPTGPNQRSPLKSPLPGPSASAAPADLCRQWRAAERDPKVKHVLEDRIKPLITGQPASVAAYCSRVLGDPTPSPAAPGGAAPSPPAPTPAPGEDSGKDLQHGPKKPK
jgi:hypothetical protein